MDLCKTQNYTKTAANLHITQPAVTQHIKYLENYFGAKLFSYSGRNLSLTKQGQLLEEFTSKMYADYNKMKGLIKSSLCKPKKIKFGVPGTIGEYLMPNVIEKYLEYEQNEEFIMIVDFTENLLGKVKSGDIDFAIIDGFFNKADYECTLLFKEPTIAICAKNHKFANAAVSFDDLLSERLIVREEGSEGRYNLELLLREKNLSVDNFHKLMQIGHWNAAKNLVQKGLGIAFLYRDIVKNDIKNNLLCEINIKDFNVTREINFVWLKGSLFTEEGQHFLDYCKRFMDIS
ncbi:MAG: LysR family transcriptional regulator [Dehalobacterium sp.]